MYQLIAYNIIHYFRYTEDKLYLLVDEAYYQIAKSIKKIAEETEIRIFRANSQEDFGQVFDLPSGAVVFLLAEPESYSKYKVFQYLDFSKGEPQIPGMVSRVLIFPVESICRIFGGNISENIMQKQRLLSTMKSNQKYRITTALGTDLIFESRYWIPLDFEVCTAPMEETVNGVIVVDGALFFKKIENTLTFVIKNGKIQSIAASSKQGEELVNEYKNMTTQVMTNAPNTQLAEIGIGFCNGAEINDCFMEAEVVINTCHFCFGNNICYGGKNESDFHGASILIKEPVFTCIERGSYGGT